MNYECLIKLFIEIIDKCNNINEYVYMVFYVNLNLIVTTIFGIFIILVLII